MTHFEHSSGVLALVVKIQYMPGILYVESIVHTICVHALLCTTTFHPHFVQVGDMISVIDMPGPEESIWWRGKRGFEVGFFPCECVEVIGDKVLTFKHF